MREKKNTTTFFSVYKLFNLLISFIAICSDLVVALRIIEEICEAFQEGKETLIDLGFNLGINLKGEDKSFDL